jgi:uncharacterized protein (UPF0276 family)
VETPRTSQADCQIPGGGACRSAECLNQAAVSASTWLRAQHYDEILNGNPPIDWFEVISENYMLPRPAAAYPRPRVRALSCRDARRVNVDRIDRAAQLRIPAGAEGSRQTGRAKWVSDHLCWTGVHGKNLHDLLPIPTPGSARSRRQPRPAGRIFSAVPRAENVSTYVQFNNLK